ncbi:hypothetical protein KA005_56700 [bacterium]|nr:hypothetical protein [bacterium]
MSETGSDGFKERREYDRETIKKRLNELRVRVLKSLLPAYNRGGNIPLGFCYVDEPETRGISLKIPLLLRAKTLGPCAYSFGEKECWRDLYLFIRPDVKYHIWLTWVENDSWDTYI